MAGSALQAFGWTVRAYRAERDLSIRAMASNFDMSPATLSRIERGKGCLLETFDALCLRMKVDHALALDEECARVRLWAASEAALSRYMDPTTPEQPQ